MIKCQTFAGRTVCEYGTLQFPTLHGSSRGQFTAQICFSSIKYRGGGGWLKLLWVKYDNSMNSSRGALQMWNLNGILGYFTMLSAS